MCGIIGYVGHQSCVELIFNGLKRLEYRGYDSAGIAVQYQQEISLVKKSGKLLQLKPLLNQLPHHATIGLGHTRWATHGPPTTANAHPHVADKIALVHNGIIENYQDLKSGLEAGGARFQSETDTEVILLLLAEELKRIADPEIAIVNLVKKLKGAYSLGILIPQQKPAIYLVKQGSPLVIGVGRNENFFASDVSALIEHTKEAIFLNDGEFACVEPGKISLWDFEGQEKSFRISQLQWSAESMEKGGYPHFMLKEIHEQPLMIANAAKRFVDLETGRINTSALGIGGIGCHDIHYIHIVGCGSAYLSGVIGKYLLEKLCGLPVNVELASEFRYRQPYLTKNTLVIAVTQSGETMDTLHCVKEARKHGCQTLAICNVAHAEIPRQSVATIYMDAGPEIGVASTKAFTSMVFCQFLFAHALKCTRQNEEPRLDQVSLTELRVLPHALQQVLESADINSLAKKYYQAHNFLFIGRGPNSPVAFEGALKLKEISYIHAEGYAAGELKHGPIALIDRNMPVVAIAPQDCYYEKSLANIEEVRARHGQIIGVGSKTDDKLNQLCADVIHVPQVKEMAFQALLNTIPLQLFAYHIAVLRGTDVDQPRNLAKAVTVE